MPISTSFRLKFTAGVGLGELQLRTVPGVARPFNLGGMEATVTNTGPAALLGPGTLTQHRAAYSYDDFIVLTLPFNITVGNLTTSQVLVSSYGMIMFGHDGSVNDWFYNLDDGNANPWPTIVHGSAGEAGASAFQKLYAGAENSGSTYRIRLEMWAGWDDPLDGSVNTVWEVTFYQANPDKIRIDFGTSGYEAVDNAWGMVAGIGDGLHLAHVGAFAQGVVNVAYEVLTIGVAAEGAMTASHKSQYAFYACDGDTQTAWADTGGASPASPITLTYTFNTPMNIKEYVVQCWGYKPVLNLGWMLKDWTFEYLDNGTWKVADTQTGQIGWSHDEARVFSMPSNDGEVFLLPLDVQAVGNLNIDTLLGDNLTLPPMTLLGKMAAGDFGAVSLPEITAAGTALVASVGQGDCVAERMTARGQGIVGQAIHGGIVLPVPQLAGALDGALPLPELGLVGTMSTGTVSNGRSTLLRMTMSGSMEPALPLPMMEVDGAMMAGPAMIALCVLPRLDIAGASYAGSVGLGAAVLPLLDVIGGPEGMVTLPQFDAVGAAVAGTVASAALTLPAPEVAATYDNGAAIVMPALQLAATGRAGTVATGTAAFTALAVAGGTQEPIALPGMTLAGRAQSGANGVANVVLAKPTLAATADPAQGLDDGAAHLAQLATDGVMLAGIIASGSALMLPARLTALAAGGPLGVGAATLAQLGVAGMAHASGDASGTIALRAWQLAASADNGVVVDGAVQLAAATLDATAATGNIASATLTLPLLAVSADGYFDTVGSATVTLPGLLLDAAGEGSVTAPVFTSVVLNTRNRAASTYEGLAFNSMATFNGVVLAASADGIVALTGDDDDGQAVAAMLAGGVSDLESEQFKRVLAGYAGYSTSGNIELTMITDSHHEYVYVLEPRQIGEAHASRVKFGRGVEGRYWQWRLANRAGADFALNTLTLDAVALSRRI